VRQELHRPPTTGAGTSGGRRVLRALPAAVRVQQWSKNVLLFAAPGAAGVLDRGSDLERVVVAALLFCLLSSGTYLANDAMDAAADRLHPTKRLRPVAAGVIKPRTALVAGVLSMVLATGLAFLVTWRLAVVMALYVAVQLAYSARLKHVAVYDLACVAAGFVLRALAGAVAVHVPVSQWFLIVATFGSLLMVTGKRLAEQLELGAERGGHRRTLDAYSPTFLRTVLAVSAGAAIIGYCLWAFDLQTALRHHADPIWFQLSIVPMLLALLRYTYLVEQGRGARPEQLVFSDRSLPILGLVWAALFAVAVYGH
jgi:decaprenyl-phosphate phosphoribosyltransferase